VKRASQAANWKQFEREADVLPNLEWLKTTSVTPAADHAGFWSIPIILPVNDPFWDTHKPGDRWGCKCSLRATDKQVTPDKSVPEAKNTDKPAPGLTGNPAKDGQIFSDTHPYNPPFCAACTLPGKRVISKNQKPFTGWLAGMFNAAGKKDCYHCSKPVQLINECRKKTAGAKAVRKWAKENIQGTTVKHADFEKGIQISGKGIREFTNQPHKFFFEKNNLLKDIQGVFDKATYKGETIWKDRKSHIFEIVLMGEKNYLIVNEYNRDKPILYSITDSDNVLRGIEKP
jgi:hypothetical protein